MNKQNFWMNKKKCLKMNKKKCLKMNKQNFWKMKNFVKPVNTNFIRLNYNWA